jgi:thiol:disulfide interchange protein DsbC
MNTVLRVLALMTIGCLPLLGQAEASLTGEAAAEIYARLDTARPGLPILSIAPAPVPGLYAVALDDGTILYATEDGQHLLAGDLYEIGAAGLRNRSEDVRAVRRLSLLDEVPLDDMIVFPAKGERLGVVNVFTDVDCGFCQKLHQEVPALNARGIEVRYLAFPRAGVGSGAYDKIVSAWCASDPRAALTRLKAGDPVEPKRCANPVADQYRRGPQLGVRGTPALFLEDGRYLPGYLPAESLAAEMGLDG